MRIVDDVKLDFCDVLICPKRSKAVSRAEVDLTRTYKFFNSTSTWTGLPIIAANMMTGTFAMAHALSKIGAMTALHKYYSVEQLVRFYEQCPDVAERTFYTLGISEDDFGKLKNVLDSGVKIQHICLDAANAYSNSFIESVFKLRKLVGKVPVILAGNICTSDVCREILFAGADILKIGLGSGAACRTRMVSGIGYCQLSAVIECSDASHGTTSETGGGLICSDGGCREPGDVVKAFAGGSDFTMLGGMLSATDPCEGDWVYDEHGQKKSYKFFGMSSEEANDKFNGGLRDYRASEGACEYVPYKGPVEKVMQQITGGLRSACTYVGTNKLKDLSKCTTFIKVNRIHR